MKKATFIILLLTSIITQAQQLFKGKVTTASNHPLSGATITVSSGPSVGTTSDQNGEFSLEVTKNTEILINYIGYTSKKIVLTASYTQIVLEEENQILEEVLVTSASRETQKRSEVPGSIATLNAKSIKTSKAFGIDQLVNQIPGVLMSTSRAGSNEQHFMAVRSPISTKSLFLYLEDGLPIRPTSVFNHNALLEMNNTSFGRIEVLKGPASSIYGSEAIGGSFNFITKNPTEKLSGGFDYQQNDLGFSRYEVEVSNQANEKLGFYVGGHYAKREDGPIAHSDYEKLAFTLKTVYDFSPNTRWTSVIDAVDYRSDMAGSLSESDYSNGNYESDQTFTERDAVSFRFRSTLDQQWNDNHKTAVNLIFRSNRMDQIPSYRIRQFRNQGKLTGSGSGEVNSNKFTSYVGLIQHKINFDFAASSLIIGASTDYSPQKYEAERISVFVDPTTGINTGYEKKHQDYILNYHADIFNHAAYMQYEITPIEALKITAALRYDYFKYDYDNQNDGISGAKDSENNYDNIAPKLGINYNFNKKSGIYANYSNGFTPPQTSTLYRNSFVGVDGEVFDLKPSRYDNYEIGGYFVLPSKLKFDAAIYLLEGKNTLITLRNENDEFFNSNAGKTRSYGIEYGLTYMPVKGISLTHNGSYAKHRYVTFYDRGVDYSDTDRNTAPSITGTSIVSYQTKISKELAFNIAAEHELVGSYNTSFENQVIVEDADGNPILTPEGDEKRTTATYDGHSIFNLRASIQYKNIEVWGHFLNVFDELYAVRASYNRFRGSNSYSIGNPRAFHLGLRYNL
ncbi:TonB-dependent receptor [Aquimarina hainanensis]|uniref:TonB-dependent receptor n=1 Tax=Aquimarina hainanensis TaxID=1578017 RepID=A0ABW5N5F5_9FLAO